MDKATDTLMAGWLQRTLDLFGAAPPAPTAPLPNHRAGAADTPHDPATQHVHPRANRTVTLVGEPVAYLFRVARRRTIGFSVGAEGLVVSAPRWVARREVDAALHEKADWIVRKLRETQQQAQVLESMRVQWRDGCELPYLGAPLKVVLDAQSATAHARLRALVTQAESGVRELRLGLPVHCEPARIRDAVQAWLMRQARAHFAARLDHFAPQLGVQWQRLRLSSAGTRWGSASADGGISLNWRLVHFAPAVIDYVVVHELSHLRVMDHSPRFWDTVAGVLPEYDRLRDELRTTPLAPWR